jgi:hypothetical protein
MLPVADSTRACWSVLPLVELPTKISSLPVWDGKDNSSDADAAAMRKDKLCMGLPRGDCRRWRVALGHGEECDQDRLLRYLCTARVFKARLYM